MCNVISITVNVVLTSNSKIKDATKNITDQVCVWMSYLRMMRNEHFRQAFSDREIDFAQSSSSNKDRFMTQLHRNYVVLKT